MNHSHLSKKSKPSKSPLADGSPAKQQKMPSLTIDGKRSIIAMAKKSIGEKALLQWLKPYDIPSMRHLDENVRRYKTKFFEAMFKLVE